jgi:hypothetical protein
MRRGAGSWLAGLAIVATVACALPWTAAAAASAPVSCGSGTTLFVHGTTRIFSVPGRIGAAKRKRGSLEYACRGRHGTATRVGEDYAVARTGGDSSSYGYAFGGARFVARSRSIDDPGTCGTHGFAAFNLKAGARLWSDDGLDCGLSFGTSGQDFRVLADGTLVYPRVTNGISTFDNPVVAVKAGSTQRVRLSSADVHHIRTSDIAARGDLVYWTEFPQSTVPAQGDYGAPVARSASLGDDRTGPEPVALQSTPAPRNTGRCARRPGATVARTPLVRVVRRRTSGGHLVNVACRITRDTVVALPSGRLAEVRIAHERWVLARTAFAATVADVKSGKVVASVSATAPAFAQTTLLDDGTFAWIEPADLAGGGQLIALAPRSYNVVVLASADAGPSALASAATRSTGPRAASASRRPPRPAAAVRRALMAHSAA